MASGRPRNLGKTGALLALALVSGCAGASGRLTQALIADRQPEAHARDLEAHYRVHCADVLRVEVRDQPANSGPCKVALDGRITLADHHVEVEGRATGRIAALVAQEVGARESDVRVSVHEYNSQQLYLFGEIATKNQILPYRGPETVLDLLHRVDGGTWGAALADVRVVRSHVADGLPPEVFHVDLDAILVKKDLQTNIRLEPSDHIYVGQSRRSKVACQLPPWLQQMCRCKKRADAPEGSKPETRK
jgi:polysaccharide biosynthesis/export protein